MGLEGGRGTVVEGGVEAQGVVVGVDEGKDLCGGIGLVDEATALEHLALRVPMNDSVQALW